MNYKILDKVIGRVPLNVGDVFTRLILGKPDQGFLGMLLPWHCHVDLFDFAGSPSMSPNDRLFYIALGRGYVDHVPVGCPRSAGGAPNGIVLVKLRLEGIENGSRRVYEQVGVVGSINDGFAGTAVPAQTPAP